MTVGSITWTYHVAKLMIEDELFSLFVNGVGTIIQLCPTIASVWKAPRAKLSKKEPNCTWQMREHMNEVWEWTPVWMANKQPHLNTPAAPRTSLKLERRLTTQSIPFSGNVLRYKLQNLGDVISTAALVLLSAKDQMPTCGRRYRVVSYSFCRGL